MERGEKSTENEDLGNALSPFQFIRPLTNAGG
jgi:hypothetical protein